MLRPLLLAAGAAVVGLQALHARRHWGATAGEVAAVLPGDEFVPDPAENATLAVSVAAPPEQVWPWLCRWARTAAACTATTGWTISSA